MDIGSSPITSATPRFATTWTHLESTNPDIKVPTSWTGSFAASMTLRPDASPGAYEFQPDGSQ